MITIRLQFPKYGIVERRIPVPRVPVKGDIFTFSEKDPVIETAGQSFEVYAVEFPVAESVRSAESPAVYLREQL